jgi:hypothetical protein
MCQQRTGCKTPRPKFWVALVPPWPPMAAYGSSKRRHSSAKVLIVIAFLAIIYVNWGDYKIDSMNVAIRKPCIQFSGDLQSILSSTCSISIA